MRTRLSEYFVLSLSAYITVVAVYFTMLRGVQTTGERLGLTALFVVFGLLCGLVFRVENRPRLVNLGLALMTAILVVIFLLGDRNLDSASLYFVLSAYAMLFLPVRNGALWLLLFFIIVGIEGYSIFGLAEISILVSMGGGFAFFGFVGAALRRAEIARQESERLLKELQQAHHQLQEYSAQAEQLAVAEERNRLAREMHDSLGHRLTVAVVQLEGAQRLIPIEPERAASMVGTMREQLKTALNELRQTVSALRTAPEEELPLPAAIRRLAGSFQTATGLPIHLYIPAGFPALPAAHRLTLYRAIQECLTNIQRHAKAGQIWLDIETQNGAVILSVSDDGQGFPATIREGHFGLEGLRERTVQLGGDMQLGARPEGGARVRLQLPLEGIGQGEFDG
jgi:signal transduction histidine kinase